MRVDYVEALARARRELVGVKQYAHPWDQGAAYLGACNLEPR